MPGAGHGLGASAPTSVLGTHSRAWLLLPSGPAPRLDLETRSPHIPVPCPRSRPFVPASRSLSFPWRSLSSAFWPDSQPLLSGSIVNDQSSFWGFGLLKSSSDEEAFTGRERVSE